MSPEHILKHWRNFKNEALFIRRANLPRKWWDDNLVQSMECWGEPKWKQKVVYAGVRLGGWYSFKRSRPLKPFNIPRLSVFI